MTLRTFLKAAKHFRRAAEKLQPGSVRKLAAGGRTMQAYEDRRADLDEAITAAEADIRRTDRLSAVASRAAELLDSIAHYEARMADSKATRRWDWPMQAAKMTDELRTAVAATREPDSLWGQTADQDDASTDQAARAQQEPEMAASEVGADEPTNTRNAAGVKWSSDCYRTIDGVRWGQWISEPSKERIAAYKAAGVRCRKVKQSGECFELFVHPEDERLASTVDEIFEEPADQPVGAHPQP